MELRLIEGVRLANGNAVVIAGMGRLTYAAK
jgi:hypothetical protein